MAGYAVTDAAALRQIEKRLWEQLRTANAQVRRIGHEISMIQFGRAYEPRDPFWIPPFLRKEEAEMAVIELDDWDKDFLSRSHSNEEYRREVKELMERCVKYCAEISSLRAEVAALKSRMEGNTSKRLQQRLARSRQRRESLRGFLRRANDDLRVASRHIENLKDALRDISRQPEGDEQSAQAVAKEALRGQRCTYPSCLDGDLRCSAMWKGECFGPREVQP